MSPMSKLPPLPQPPLPDPKAPVFKTHVAPTAAAPETQPERAKAEVSKAVPVREIGGPAGPEPTRYGDWERKGRCSDF
nr:succinate dehydrogenase assembly factor 4 [Nitrospirillum iridis]